MASRSQTYLSTHKILVNALQASLRELKEEFKNENSLVHRSTPTQREDLEALFQCSKSGLHSLQTLLSKYRSLGGTNPRTRDILGFTANRQAEIRGRLKRHSDKLNLLLTRLHAALWHGLKRMERDILWRSPRYRQSSGRG